MTKSGLQETTSDDAVKLENLQPICICNNSAKKALACTNYYDDIPDDENMSRVGNVTIEDIKQNAVLRKVLSFYKKHNQKAIQSACNNCKLSDLQKESICKMKRNGLTLANIQKMFSLYILSFFNYLGFLSQ